MNSVQLNEIFRMAELSARYVSKELTDAEKQELNQWIARNDNNKKLFEDFTDPGKRELVLEQMRKYNPSAAWDKTKEKIIKRRPMRRWWLTAAAIITLTIGSILFFQLIHTTNERPSVADTNTAPSHHDIKPGGTKAMLILASGKSIRLDKDGDSTFRLGASVLVLQNGIITYNAKESKSEDIQYNKLVTPRGGQFQLVLPDGSKVWLNAESSLEYPTAFVGTQRIVTLTGEAYFEVEENNNLPFKVIANGVEVNVLGTHFNIMAYQNEKLIKTTLLEGKVKVTRGSQSKLLKPGEVASFDKAKERLSVGTANKVQAIAWKNGYFDFREATLKEIMRQLSRWYNVEVEYQGEIPERHFTGEAPRNLNLSDVLKILATSGIHFSVQDRQIMVKP